MATKQQLEQIVVERMTGDPAQMRALIERRVDEYIAAHPGYRYPPGGDRHPAILALSQEMRNWLVFSMGGTTHYWLAMLAAAQSWFPHKSDALALKYFCYMFEAVGNLGADADPEYLALSRIYHAWRTSVSVRSTACRADSQSSADRSG